MTSSGVTRKCWPVSSFFPTSAAEALLLLVGTVRTEEVTATHPFTALHLSLRQTDQFQEIALAPFSIDTTAQLGAHVSGAALSPEQARRLYEETEGNPLFVVETLRAQLGGGGGAQGEIDAPSEALTVRDETDRFRPRSMPSFMHVCFSFHPPRGR